MLVYKRKEAPDVEMKIEEEVKDEMKKSEKKIS
jgi:hypothetical protein